MLVAERVVVMGIELKDFVAETLREIIDGVISVQEYAKGKEATVMPGGIYGLTSSDLRGSGILGTGTNYVNTIDFDIAVTASESAKSKGGIGVFISVVGAGVQGQDEASNSTVSRIKFTIPISLPRQKE